ncbi:MAG: N-6 DNA methylase [Clostridiales bacterium]|jgi:type I restriction enzyme M protein|nr:N-6 DNA methylase [Clostridiales bacterium]
MNTTPLEMDTRNLINKSLENLGWVLDGTQQNVYFEQPKTETEKKKLGGKRPDYVLYSSDKNANDKPLIVIEAKKKGERLDTALEQGVHYARQLEAPIVFATDGLFCKSYHTKFDRTPILNGEEVDEFLREALALKYLSQWEVNTVSPKVQYDRKELIKIFDEANNMLRGEGLRAGIERFGEFANILFLKLISETEQIKEESGEKSDFDSACRWDAIKNIPATARIDYINATVFERLNTRYNTPIFTPLTIRSESILKEIMDKLDPLMLTDVDSDVKGDAFEYFLKESAATKNDLGEYFTPRHIVKTMVKLVNPQIGEKIYDPFCGTGGFLIESFRHIWNTMARNDENKSKLKEKTIYGNEITNTARITKMNMILAGDGHSNIHMKDSLANPVDGMKNEGYDIVITNMPYSQKTKYGSLYDLPSNNGDSICVQHCMKAINATAENGRMALVVPEGFLFRKDLAKTRELLMKNSNLQSVVSLPQGVFLPYTGVKTDIIYATKVNQKLKAADKRKDFWYFEVKNDGYTLDNHRRKLDVGNDLEKPQEYRKLDEDQRQEMMDVGFETIPIEKVKNNSYILVGSRYREQSQSKSMFELLPLKAVTEIIAGQSPDGSNYNTQGNGIPFYQGNADFGSVCLNAPQKWTTQITKTAITSDILLSVRAPVGAVNICNQEVCIGRGLMALRAKNITEAKYLFYVLKGASEKLRNFSSGSTFEAITKKDVEDFKIPVPSFEIQQQIVDELDSYQRIIDGARAVADNYSRIIRIGSDWELRKVGDMCKINSESVDPSQKYGESEFVYIDISSIENSTGAIERVNHIKGTNAPSRARRVFKYGDILMSTVRPNLKAFAYVDFDAGNYIASTGFAVLTPENVSGKFLYYMLFQDFVGNQLTDLMSKGMYPSINKSDVESISIPVPSIEVQQQIASEIEKEESLVEPSKQLVKVFTKKIQNRINEIWGEKV